MYTRCLILCGGSGTRLWPLSNSQLSKQFLTGPGGLSFFQASLRRGLSLAEQIIVICGAAHRNKVLESCDIFSEEERKRIIVVVEPRARNTALPVLIATLNGTKGEGVEPCTVLVLASDHCIEPGEAFSHDALLLEESVRKEGLGVFGIKPDEPKTGFGYIETVANDRLSGNTIMRVKSFHEKPDEKTAVAYLEAGNYYWNSGMFAFEAGFMQEEFRRYAPEMAALVEGLEFPAAEDYRQEKEIKILDNWPGLGEVYEKSPSISFDYAIAEKCKKVFMLKASFTWSDVGSWDDYIRFATPSPEVFAVNAPLEGKNGNFVLSDIPVALCGVENLIVSICIPGDGQPAVALIARKGSSQDVKKIVSQIKTRGRDALL